MKDRAAPEELARHAESVRSFNRFYTKRIGVLHEGLLESPFSLAEARVLYELAHREAPTASELGEWLDLDPGYLSRILHGFEKRGLLRRATAPGDRRRSLLRLTARGRRTFAPLEARSHADARALVASVPAAEQARLVEAMRTIERLLGPGRPPSSYLLRPHQPGDMGWVVHRHGVLYAREHGYDERFEALVAGIVARFVERFDPKRERCWIAEREGAPVGSVFLVRRSARVAQLRLLLVEPQARGLGIGARLVDECVAFARRTGYRTLRLWTQRGLEAARRIYEQAGFRLVHEEPHDDWGLTKLVSQTWERDLNP